MNKNNIKYTQEQAVASWVKYLNTIRFENLMNSLNEQDVNLDKAITSLDNNTFSHPARYMARSVARNSVKSVIVILLQFFRANILAARLPDQGLFSPG